MSPIYRTSLAVPCFSISRSAFLCLALVSPWALAADPAPAAAPPAAPAAPRTPIMERSEEDALALTRTLPAAEQVQLQAGSDNFLALWRPANAPNGNGVVIIVPGTGETADWPQAVGPLRRKLPDGQWASLSLTVPDLLSDSPQPRAVAATPTPTESKSQSTPADANAPVEQATAADADPGDKSAAADSADEQSDADAQRIFARIDAGIAYAQTQKARSIVLLGHGSGAYWATRYLTERQPSRAQRLVMVAARAPQGATQPLEQLTSQLKVPAVDIFYGDEGTASKTAKARLEASKRVTGSQYRQVNLTVLPGDPQAEQEQLYRRVRGWLSPDKDL
ncbi:MAG: alpha/beta hydrolase family protein [Janthinobacterium lividum]|uniref:alpha/beta hydrolase family protein n=1 Tax=Pseudomonas baltica TaxID=2762576 RepID=UPI00289E93C8|nr:alpha/beta hydrolase family protein [Pseudomonas baltica]